MTESKPRVTILIPTYNRGEFLIGAIKSCISQSYTNISIIVYDDGSTDNTKHMMLELCNTFSNIKYIKNGENNGIGYARNQLLKLANSEIACWLDSDDLLPEDRIEKTVKYLQDNPKVDILYTDLQHFKVIDSHIIYGKEHKIDITKYDSESFDTLKHNTACATAVFRKKIYQVMFESDLSLGGEDVLWLWKILTLGHTIGHLSESLYYYRSHPNRIGNNKKLECNIEKKQEENKYIAKFIAEYSVTTKLNDKIKK